MVKRWDACKDWFKVMISKESKSDKKTESTSVQKRSSTPTSISSTSTTTTISSDSVARKDTKPLEAEEIDKLVQKYTEGALDEISHKLREDFLTIFGLFAAFLAFIVIEVQVFIQVHRFSLLMGFSLFFLAALILFVLALHNVVKGKNDC